MAITAIVAAISTASAVIGAGGVAAFSFTGFGLSLTGFSAVAASFLVTTAMGAALNALAPKPKIGAAGSQGYSLSGQSGAALDHQIIYGEARVGGARVYDSSTGGNNEYLHRILAFAGHEIDSYQEIYLNDEVVTLDGSGNVTSPSKYNGFVRIKTYLGTTTQTADTDLVNETSTLTDGIWTTDHRLQGIAYIYVRFKYNQDAFPNGVPAVSAKIRGKKVFDPRTSTTAWSDNPALCVRDYLTSDYGLAQTSGRIDDTLVSAAANICDQTVESEKRYTCNGAFTTGLEPSAIATNLLTSMGGLLWYGQGKWRMKASAWTAPTVSFDENDLRSGISLSTRHSRRDNFNSVKGTFAGDETDWQSTDYPEVTDPAFLAADNNLVNVLDFPLPFTSSSLTAQRIARIALNRNREQLTFSASFGMRAFQVQVGDFVNITNTRFGWTDKPFEIVEWNFGLTDGLDIQINMTLREISEGVFTSTTGQPFELNNTTLPDVFSGLSIQNLGAFQAGRVQGDGTFVNGIVCEWDIAENSFVTHYEVEWKSSLDADYFSTTTVQNSIELAPIIDGLEYTFRVRAVAITGNKGAYSSVSLTAGGDDSIPSIPTSLEAFAGYRYIGLSWDAPTTNTDTSALKDLLGYKVYRNTTNNFATATLIASTGATSFTDTGLSDLATLFYWVSAVDFSGNESSNSAPASTTTLVAPDGERGPGRWNIPVVSLPTTSSEANTAFEADVGTPVDRDQAWFYTGTESAPTEQNVWIYNLSTDTWTEQTEVIDGDLLVDGTITADKLIAQSISALGLTIGTLSDNPTGERIVFSDSKIEVYDSTNTLRVVLGDLT
jgi:hypothetical protein